MIASRDLFCLILKAFDLTPANIRDQAKLLAADLKSIDEGETKMAAAQ